MFNRIISQLERSSFRAESIAKKATAIAKANMLGNGINAY